MTTLSCGNCGGKTFSISFEGKDSHRPDEMLVTCLACGSSTIVRPVKAAMELDWGSKSEGILCVLGDHDA